MRIKKNHLLVALLMLLMIFAFTACGGKDGGSSKDVAEKEARDVLTVQISADPGDLSPYNTNTTESSRVKKQIYEPLLDLGYNMEIVPVLASSWEQEDDLHWIFHLREGVKFTNGEEFTADDVLFSLRTAYNIKLSKKYVESVDVDACEAIDDYTVRFALTKNDAFFLTGLTAFVIVNKEAYEADPDNMVNNPVGSGPYKFVDWRLGSSVTIERNDEYWGKKASIKTIVYRPIGEAAQRAIELETGGVDIVLDLQASDYNHLSDNPDFEVYGKIGFRSKAVYFNNDKSSVMSNKTLRQAISYAIDTESIATVAYSGFASPSFSFFTEGFVNYDKRFDNGVFYSQDFEKAKALLKEAGYPDGLEIKIFISDKPLDVTCSEIIQNQLAQIGVKATISSFESAVYNPTIGNPKSGWDMALTALQCPSGNFIDYFNAFLAADGLNRPSYQNDEFNVLVKEAVVTTNEARTTQLEDRIVEILTDDMPFRPLAQEKQLYAWNKEVKNFQVWGQNNVHFVDVSF